MNRFRHLGLIGYNPGLEVHGSRSTSCCRSNGSVLEESRGRDCAHLNSSGIHESVEVQTAEAHSGPGFQGVLPSAFSQSLLKKPSLPSRHNCAIMYNRSGLLVSANFHAPEVRQEDPTVEVSPSHSQSKSTNAKAVFASNRNPRRSQRCCAWTGTLELNRVAWMAFENSALGPGGGRSAVALVLINPSQEKNFTTVGRSSSLVTGTHVWSRA